MQGKLVALGPRGVSITNAHPLDRLSESVYLDHTGDLNYQYFRMEISPFIIRLCSHLLFS